MATYGIKVKIVESMDTTGRQKWLYEVVIYDDDRSERPEAKKKVLLLSRFFLTVDHSFGPLETGSLAVAKATFSFTIHVS